MFLKFHDSNLQYGLVLFTGTHQVKDVSALYLDLILEEHRVSCWSMI